jgi:TorA maturation chaperone TorD
MEVLHPFHFLSGCFSYPDEEGFLDNTIPLELLTADLGMEVAAGPQSPPSLVDLQAEYVRLFINGPGGVAAPPYASVYVNHSGLLRQQGYDEALALYRRAGLEPEQSTESPDHLAHELAFLSILLDRDDLVLAASFLQDHLCKWYPRFHERLLAAEPIFFYRFLAQVTDLCLKQTLKEVLHEQTTFS